MQLVPSGNLQRGLILEEKRVNALAEFKGMDIFVK